MLSRKDVLALFKTSTCLFLVAALIPLLAACSQPVATSPTTGQSVPLETQVAAAIAATMAEQTVIANAVAGTLTALPTDTLAFTYTATPVLTASLPPTDTLTPSPAVPMAKVTITTNCRSGPTTAYDVLGILIAGESAQVVGRSLLTDTMIIRLPSRPDITCWLWAQNASVAGNISSLPIIPIPSTPTPKATIPAGASFSVVYLSTIQCNGKYALKFKIINTGSVSWESNSIFAFNQDTNENHAVSYDTFPDVLDGCSLAGNDQNLEAGEMGFSTSGEFSTNPYAHDFTAAIRVCSQDGLAGTCLDQALKFTP